VDPNMAVNIEHEDVELGRLEGLHVAAQALKTANSATVSPSRFYGRKEFDDDEDRVRSHAVSSQLRVT
jgi:hypothetical protein